MNGIEKIIERIQADAQADIDVLLDEAEQDARDVMAQYQTRAAALGETLMEKGKKDAIEHQGRLISIAQMECKKKYLATKQDCLDKAFQYAFERLTEISDEDYVNLLTNLAVRSSLSGEESIVFSSYTKGHLGAEIVSRANAELEKQGKVAKLSISEETREFGGGLILLDGRMEVNCSFDTLLRLCREETASTIAGMLF